MSHSYRKRFRHKVLIFFVLLAIITFLLLYITGPRLHRGPSIKVLHISYATQRISEGASVVTVIFDKQNSSTVIDQQEWNLISEVQQLYKNNIVLECTASFPIYWNYQGYGVPTADIENVRKVDNFNDTNTYSFVSLLNLMPLREISTGKYVCSSVEDDSKSSFVHLFVPGDQIFIIQNEISIESDTAEKLTIPCPVSSLEANVSLLFKGKKITDDYVKYFHPETGFALNAKFMEENDHFGEYQCEDLLKRKSGKIDVSPKREGTVKVEPSNTSIIYTDEFDGTFKCESKENVTLKFRKVYNPKKIIYSIDTSSEFPYKALVKFLKKDLKDGSAITCITIGQRSVLHVWKVSFSKTQNIETPQFFYKEDMDEYACCGTSLKRPKLTKLDCLNPSECLIKKTCLESDSCKLKSTRLIEKSACLHYKVEYENGNNISSGLFKCSVGDRSNFYNYFNIKNDKGILSDFSPYGIEKKKNLSSQSILKIDQVFIRRYGTGIKIKLKCQGPKYYLASGFVWQIVRYNGLVDFFVGNEYFDGPWVRSQVEFEVPFDDQRQAKKVNCFAPIWNSPRDWIFASKFIPNILD